MYFCRVKLKIALSYEHTRTMHTHAYRVAFFIFITFFITNLSAQKTVKVCGEYTCRAPENVSLEQAKKTVLEQAKLAALAEEFGSTVSQWNSSIIKNENGKSDISFFSLGGSEVNGEWIEDLNIKYGDPYYDKEMLVISVSVCGKAREITKANIDFSAKVLNDAEKKYETDNFNDGQNIYLAFRSPVNGYLAVYLVDEDETAFCLLPYSKDPTGKVPVKAGQEYIFFSPKHANPTEKQFVEDGYTLSCDSKSIETNFLYIIFSPNEFIKANDIQKNKKLPRELSFEDFRKWLAKNKQRDKDMQEEVKSLTIRK